MALYKFDNNTSFNEYDEYVLDWARDGVPHTPAMRVREDARVVQAEKRPCRHSGLNAYSWRVSGTLGF